MINFIINKIRRIIGFENLKEKIDHNILLNGKNLIENNLINFPNSINRHEVKVFSQSGEDGIIQFIISKIKNKNCTFVEFGCENYVESNTRYLLYNNNWKGLIIDGNKENVNEIKKSNYHWKHDLTVLNKFINKDNINNLLEKYKFNENLGLLSIDMDGNDYWILKELKHILPDIIICEYNSLLGKNNSITLKYNEKFVRSNSSFNKINYGASIKAIHKLLSDKYILVYGNKFGNNLFFVNQKYKDLIQEKSIDECYSKISFNELVNITENRMTYDEISNLIDISKFEDV